MNAQFSISATLRNSANYLVCGLATAAAPNIIIQTIVPTKNGSVPYYPDPFQVIFTGLLYGTAYIFRLYESPDMTAQGLVRNYSEFTALGQSVIVRASLFIIADTTPGFSSGQPSYVDTSLAGWIYDLENRGQGTVEPTTEVTISGTGGWTLITGEVIQPGQVFVHHFLPQIQTAPPPPSSGVSTGHVLTTDTVLDSTYVNTEICLQGAIPQYFTITLPPLNTLADYAPLWFNSAGGNHVNVVIKCAGSDMIIRNINLTQIILGQNEKLELYKARGEWYVKDITASVDIVGQSFVSDISGGINALNYSGQEVARDIYYRHWLWLNSAGPGTIPQSTWSNMDAYGNFINKGFYGDGDGSTTYRIPLIKGFISSINGLSSPGRFSIQNVGAHTHLSGMSDNPGGVNGDVYGTSTKEMPGAATSRFSIASTAAAIRQLISGRNLDNVSGNVITNTENKPADIGKYLNVSI